MDDLIVERNPIRNSLKESIKKVSHRNKPRNGRGSSMSSDYFDATLPGDDFHKEIKSGSTPIKPGVYLVFYEYIPPLAWSNVEKSALHGAGVWDGSKWGDLKTAGMAIANYQNNQWGINVQVRAYMGPLPTLNLRALLDYTPGIPINQTFYISTLEMAAKGRVSSGPHAEYIHAALTRGYDGEFIFKMDNENTPLIPIAVYDIEHTAAIKWKKLSKDEITKIGF